MNQAIALFTTFKGYGSFSQIVFTDEDIFTTGQWVIKAEIGDQLAIFVSDSENALRVGEIIAIWPSGVDNDDRQRNTFCVRPINGKTVTLDTKTDRGNTLRDRGRASAVSYIPV